MRSLSQYHRGISTCQIAENRVMREFEYTRARNIQDAVQGAAQQSQRAFIAGGTGLVDLMKLEVEVPDHLVDVNRLPLADIEETAEGGVRIGAMARNSTVAYHSLILQRYPLLSEALLSGASAQLR